MHPRDLERLADQAHDVLVIGGGIYGLAIAADAAARGLAVALVEAHDFGSAASFNHQKTAHGGLRYLQTARFGRARESIRERRRLAAIAPRLLRPLPFIVGTYRSWIRNRAAVAAAFRIDRWLGRRRNTGLEPELHLPAPRLVSRAATLKLFPGVRQQGLTGGAMWYDYQVVETERLNIAFAETADARGARLANYAEAIDPIREQGAITGMRVRDRLTGVSHDVRARITINAAGAHTGAIMRRIGSNRSVPLLTAINLVTKKPASDIALAAPDMAGRMLTLVPWRGRALIGTGQSLEFRDSPEPAVTRGEIQAVISAANEAFPALHLTIEDVALVHRGNVPAQHGAGGRPELLATPQIIDHAREGMPGAITVVGIKYTTARGVAARAVSLAVKRLGARARPSHTDRLVLAGAGIADHEALAIETARAVRLEIAPPTIRHLTALYGDRCAQIVKLMAERSDWRMPLAPPYPNIGAEVIYAIRHEMACTLADMVIRRTTIGSGGHPGPDLLNAAAAIAAEELGWDAERRQSEIAAVDAFYALPES